MTNGFIAFIFVLQLICIASGAVFLFSWLTWRRILAERALALLLASALMLATMSDKPGPWIWLAIAAACFGITTIKMQRSDHPRGTRSK